MDSVSQALAQLAKLRRLQKQRAASSASPSASTDAGLAAFIARVAPEHAPIPWHLARLVEVLERAAREPVRVLLSMPPRHAKSTTVQRAVGWLVRTQPQRLNAYVTYAQRFANVQSRKVRRVAQDAGVQFAPDAAAVHDWRTTAGGGLIATGIGGPLTGIGIDGVMVVDDPIKNREEAESPVQRDAHWEWFTDVAFTRLEPGSSCVVVATRWHADDLVGRLEQSGQGWEVINLPAVRDARGAPADEGQPLWPERFDVDALRRIRAQIGEYAWASLYQGHPVPRGGALFRVPARYAAPGLDGARIVAAVDPAGSASTRADHTAAVVLAVRGHGAEMVADVLEVLRFQEETQRAAELLAELQARHGGVTLHIEGSRDGKAIRRALEVIDPRLSLREVAPVGDKYTRAQPVVAAWNQGRVRLPAADAGWVRDLVHETEKFTGVADRQDDQVDALAYAWLAGQGADVAVGAVDLNWDR